MIYIAVHVTVLEVGHHYASTALKESPFILVTLAHVLQDIVTYPRQYVFFWRFCLLELVQPQPDTSAQHFEHCCVWWLWRWLLSSYLMQIWLTSVYAASKVQHALVLRLLKGAHKMVHCANLTTD